MSGSTDGPLGVLGGTFDPIHYGHLAIAERARDDLQLAGVAFVPAGMPPHKGDRVVTPASRRVAMAELAVADDPWFYVDRREVERHGPSYSVDTLQALADDGRELVFILSAEALSEFHAWREPQRILRLARVAVVPRAGHHAPARAWLAEHFPGQEDRFVMMDGPHLGHSGSEIRRLAAAGRSIRYLVPPPVERYVVEHELYRPELWNKN